MILSVPLAVAVIGLFIGSFLNVCIHRIPREESIVFPSSRCPKCREKIRPWDNIPVLSYLFLRGRCRHCKEKISPRYPLVETLSALIALAMLYRFGLTAAFFIYYAWACVLLVITFIDIDYQIIPDSLSIGGIVVGLALVWWLPVSYPEALIGLGVGAGLLIVVIYGYYFLTGKQGMGGGDVKLLGMIGVFTGWEGVLFTIFMGSLLGSLVGIPWALLQKKNMQAAIPFGPFLALGAFINVLFGDMLIDWYFTVLS
ncbi:MAG: Type 4 prepilin-like proteins leader peptide-processing enzyme [Deltaproteobacteria bacterium ADurb.BinA179]|nr:prepilin peptidase [Pseudomonadota bacterium]OPZ29983.1 MAG: Type 4 prepilin-like proteins leader peptide-processing enzyme [Deltaproteobacteria bacterium ADurb.BinA179]HNR50751.1 prepilin peptidase [Deltaproteobacteria bacterium]HOD70117.1 prepilin peptidase [Deltaproteobacteria bacterium]HOE71832.1 prepilin peptidase [Deltaproteobacteria bacterium]